MTGSMHEGGNQDRSDRRGSLALLGAGALVALAGIVYTFTQRDWTATLLLGIVLLTALGSATAVSRNRRKK